MKPAVNRRTRLARIAPLRSDPQRTAEWVQASRTPIARRSGLPSVSARRLEAIAAGQVKSAAGKGSAARAGTCTMCREPAEHGGWYCAACLIVRELVLERDGYACVDCGTSIIGRHYSLGHRLRASHGGKAVPSNLITLLGLGGELHHGRIDLYRNPDDELKGYRLRSWEDPVQTPVMVFSPGGSGFSAWLWDDGTYHPEGPQQEAS